MLISRNLILQGFLKSGSKSCKPEVTFAIHPSGIEKIEIMCYTDENSAFTEINSLKTDFKEVVSYIADEV